MSFPELDSFFTSIALQSVERDVLAAIIGLCVGSFLNVLALRTLAEKPFWSTISGSSACTNCGHKLGPLDLIPVISYTLLRGRCRYCKETISWQYPVVEIVTAISFVVVLHHFQINATTSWGVNEVVTAVGLDLSMLIFCCILIAVCVTDFKEKLIPHEITYPSILVGIAFSAWGRDDLMPTLAGIGISYILFDFLAFYGLKIYYMSHKDDEDVKNLEHAVRAKDKDLFAAVPIAKTSGEARTKAMIGVVEDTHVIDTARAETDYALEKTSESQAQKSSEIAGPRDEHEAINSETAQFADDQTHKSADVIAANTSHRASAFEQFEEAAVRSELFAETEVTSGDSTFPPIQELGEPEQTMLVQAPTASTEVTVLSHKDSDLDSDVDTYDPEIDEAFGLVTEKTQAQEKEEEDDFEVMGGGDAVLAALIAAWIGLENLGITLLFGFMFGSLLGSCYLAAELHRRGMLNKALQTTGIFTGFLLLVAESTVYLFARNTGLLEPGHQAELMQLPWVPIAIGSTLGGILIGTILNGKEGSKPFPFGPALAAGALVALFSDPFHKLHLSEACIQFGSFLLGMGHN